MDNESNILMDAVTIMQAAQLCGCSRERLYAAIRAGRLKALYQGPKTTLVRLSDVRSLPRLKPGRAPKAKKNETRTT